MDIKNVKTNKTTEIEGVWVDFDGETRFRIASVNSSRYRKALDSALDSAKKGRRTLSDSDREAALSAAYADAILVGWEGLTEGGAVLPYSKEAALTLMQDCPAVRDFVFMESTKHENFLAEKLEEAKSKLGELSSGN